MLLNKRYELPFPPAEVFAAWVSKQSVIAPVTAIDINARVGGVFRLQVGDGEDAHVMQGRILDIDAARHLRFTWCWNGGTESTVDVRFHAAGRGTRVLLEHSGLSSEDDEQRHAAGWDSYIQGLGQLLERT